MPIDLNAAAQRSSTGTSNTIEVTNRILRASERDLQARGYPTKRHAQSYMNPIVQAIRIADGKLDGGAIRVPTQNVSLVDLTFQPSRATSADEITIGLGDEALAGPIERTLSLAGLPGGGP